ncbi:MAG TPA: hypothetical protein VFW00_08475, partial [Rhodocyclaceae bacterium]|nr:hypothetical protein [Rhodocyclaceae bacterium]
MFKYLAILGLSISVGAVYAASINLADQPISSGTGKIANIILTPSVEYPTAVVNAHKDTTFDPNKIVNGAFATYDGYFDPYKCYTY